MDKPASLRAALVAALPEFATNPELLRMFVDKGRLVSRLSPSGLAYEWRYTLRIEIEDFQRSPDQVAVPLLLWLAVHQPERLMDFAREDTALGFAADLLDDRTCDLALAFELSEAVTVAAGPDGRWVATHLPEPAIADLAMLPGAPADMLLGEILLGEDVIAARAP